MTDPSPFDPTEISPASRALHGGTPLLRVRDLSVTFQTDAGSVNAVDGVSFDIYPGETLALVGESGSGKSVTAMSILRLIESQRGQVRAGRIQFEGRDLLTLSAAEMRAVRGNRIAMVFQEPISSLNPVYTLGTQIAETLILHRGLSAESARAEAVALLELVNMPDAERRVDEYPHQVSGGMSQRAMLAMALACRPSLLIADEPTTALDVTVQAQILELILRLQAELGMSVLMITHDLGIVAGMAHRAIVMYAGRVVEQADVFGLFDNPRHPYTAGLFDSLPRLDVDTGGGTGGIRGSVDRESIDQSDSAIGARRGRRVHARLRSIEGSVPDALDLPAGCRFHPRCRYAFEPCAERAPPLVPPRDVSGGFERLVACWRTELRPGQSYLASAEPEHVEALPPEAQLVEAQPAEALPAKPPPSDGSRGPA